MDAERWKRVDELLQAALQLPAERQEEFLRQQCGGDSELLEEVRSLLTSHRKAGSFLEHPRLTCPRVKVTADVPWALRSMLPRRCRYRRRWCRMAVPR